MSTDKKRGGRPPVTGRGSLTMWEIAALKNKGLSEAQIARLKGVSRQAVNEMWLRHGGIRTPFQEVMEHFPFVVPTRLGQCAPFKLLRYHGQFVATQGEGMTPGKLRRLRWFYRKLREDNVVLEFDPTLPPTPGVSKPGGWAYRERLPSDEDLLIRVNEYTDLTDIGRDIWRFPDTEP